MTIHSEHPFLPPEGDRDAVRRFRGRLGSAVSLWTSGASGHDRAGLTVSSLMVAGGEPGRVLALLDPDSDLCERLEETSLATVHVLAARHRDLADVFAGVGAVAGRRVAGGEFVDSDARAAAGGCPRLGAGPAEDARDVGWSREVVCVLEDVTIGDDDEPLLHRRGRYLR